MQLGNSSNEVDDPRVATLRKFAETVRVWLADLFQENNDKKDGRNAASVGSSATSFFLEFFI
jgi:hypothetical protein